MAQRYGSDVIVDLLQGFGIEYAALNPGATYRGLHDSIVNYGGNRPEIVTCTHEEIAVQIAHGYARVTGKPMVAIVHDVVGLLHCAMAIYYAHVDRAPVIVLGATGPLDRSRRRPYIDWIHSALVQGNAVRDYTKWDDQPASVADFGPSFARAFRIATQEPAGPVYVCYDAGLQEDDLAAPVDVSAAIAGARPTAVQADPAALARAADLLVAAQRPVILAEFAGRNPAALGAIAALAEAIGAPVIDLHGRLNLPAAHPLNVTGGDALADADLVLALDVFGLERALYRLDRTTHEKLPRIPAGCRIIDVGLGELRASKWSEDLGQFQPVDLAIVADTALALPELRRAIGGRVDPKARQRRMSAATAMRAQVRAEWAAEARTGWDAIPMEPARLATEVRDAIAGLEWVLTGSDLEGWVHRVFDLRDPAQWPGHSLGTATQIGMAIGVALANRGNGRLIVGFQPDGDLLFDPGALWTAANLRLPMLLVMYNNRAYYNDWEHQLRVADKRGTDKAKASIGMDLSDPAPDFALMARSFGWYSEGPIDDPSAVRSAVARGIAAIRRDGRPALLDTIVRRRELTRFR